MLAKDLFERITRRIIHEVEQGAGSYRMPWHRWGENLGSPVNGVSGRGYRGINCLLLWAAAEELGYSSGRWASYRQWTAAGAQVRRGEKSTPVLFWKTGEGPRGEEGDDDAVPDQRRFLARVYRVFNADQVDGAVTPVVLSSLDDRERIAAAESFVCTTGAQIRHGGDRACYAGSIDEIWLPQFAQFRDAESYYSVIAHELVHWTGARHRLGRNLGNRFGSEAYAMEELIAELGAAFLAARLGISLEPRPDHASYIASWLRVLRNDARAILTASSKAQEAVDYLAALAEPNSGERTGLKSGERFAEPIAA